MIQKIKGILFVVAMLFLFITIISLFIPSKISNASAVVINAPQEEIFAAINTIKGWEAWNPAVAKSPIKIAQVIKYSVSFTSFTFKNDDTENQLSIMPLVENQFGHQVQWRSFTKLKWYPWEKFRGLFLEKMIGESYKAALNALKTKLENPTKPAS